MMMMTTSVAAGMPGSRSENNFRSPIALLLFFGTTIVGVALDLWTKALARDQIGFHQEFPVRGIPDLLHLTYTENAGAVFGLGQGQRWLFVVVSIAAVAFLTYLFSISDKRRFYQFLLGMLLAGVLGNMYDRVRFGVVRDMIYALPEIHWPMFIRHMLPPNLANGGVFPWIFNVADSLLCVGVFLMIVYSLIHRPPDQPPQLSAQTNADERR
jgi:signal peptidase II